MLPGRRFSAIAIFSAVLPAATALRMRSISARPMRSARSLPSNGRRWCSMRPRSALRVEAFLWPAPSAKIEIDQLAEGQCVAFFLPRHCGIAPGRDFGKQPLRFGPRRLRCPWRAVLADRESPLRRAATRAGSVIDSIGLRAGRGHDEHEALDLGVADKVGGRSRLRAIDNPLGDLRPHGRHPHRPCRHHVGTADRNHVGDMSDFGR